MELSALYQIFLECNTVTTDSRNCPKDSMFIALKGDSFNGMLSPHKLLTTGAHTQLLTKQLMQ